MNGTQILKMIPIVYMYIFTSMVEMSSHFLLGDLSNSPFAILFLIRAQRVAFAQKDPVATEKVISNGN